MRTINRKKSNTNKNIIISFLIIMCLLLILIKSLFVYEIILNEKTIGTVKNKKDLETIKSNIINTILIENNDNSVRFTNELNIKSKLTFKKEYTPFILIEKRIENSNVIEIAASQIIINGDVVLSIADEDLLKNSILSLQELYIKLFNINSDKVFKEDYEISNNWISIQDLKKFKTEDEIIKYLIFKDNKEKRYTIKEGDLISTIARAEGLSLIEIQLINPGINIDYIMIGDEINITKPNLVLKPNK